MPKTKIPTFVFAGIVLIILLALAGLYLQQTKALSLRNYLPPGIISGLGLNSVTTESLLSEYNLVLNNQKYLLDHAKKVGVFRNQGIDLLGIERIKGQIPNSYSHSVITDLKIILSYNTIDRPTEGTIHIDTSPLTISTKFEPTRTLTITIFLLPSQIQKAQSDPIEFEKTNRAINAAVLKTIDALVDRDNSEAKYFRYYNELTQLSQNNKLPLAILSR